MIRWFEWGLDLIWKHRCNSTQHAKNFRLGHSFSAKGNEVMNSNEVFNSDAESNNNPCRSQAEFDQLLIESIDSQNRWKVEDGGCGWDEVFGTQTDDRM